MKEVAGGNSHPLYSGMISGTDSRNGSGTSSAGTLDYDYSYDYLWRLTEASLPGSDIYEKKLSPETELSAVRKGLEPSTSGVTGRHSNQLNYRTNWVVYAFSSNADTNIGIKSQLPRIFC